MKIFNMVISILMHLCSFVLNRNVASRMSSKEKDILLQIFDGIQSDVTLQNQVHLNIICPGYKF